MSCTRSRVPPKLEQLLSPARFSRHAQARARRAGGGGTSHPPTDFLAAGRTSTLPPQDEARCEEVEDNIPWSSPLRPWESRKLETANCRRSFTMSGVGNVVHKLIAGCASACCARSNCAATVCLPPPSRAAALGLSCCVASPPRCAHSARAAATCCSSDHTILPAPAAPRSSDHGHRARRGICFNRNG
jgi:hypothetical protein